MLFVSFWCDLLHYIRFFFVPYNKWGEENSNKNSPYKENQTIPLLVRHSAIVFVFYKMLNYFQKALNLILPRFDPTNLRGMIKSVQVIFYVP